MMRRRFQTQLRRRGFSFVEVLFAVIILGVGFIMVAAIFPVAMQQTKLTTEQVTGASVGRNGVAVAGGVANDSANNPIAAQSFASTKTNVLPTSGKFNYLLSPPAYAYTPTPLIEPLNYVPLYMIDAAHTASMEAISPELTFLQTTQRGNLSKHLQQSLINPTDPRSAFVMLYGRTGYFNDASTWSSSAQVIVVPVQARVQPIFAAADLTNNLQPHPVRFAILPKVALAGGVDLIVFDVANSAPEANSVNGATGGGGAVVEGACVIVGNDNINGLIHAHDVGRLNGRIFKVGARRSELDSLISTLSFTVQAAGTTYIGGTNPYLTNVVIYELDPSTPMATDLGQNEAIMPAAPLPKPIVALGVPTTPASVTFTDPDGQLAGVRHYGLAEGWVIGRGLSHPELVISDDLYEGQNMAGDAYSGFIAIK